MVFILLLTVLVVMVLSICCYSRSIADKLKTGSQMKAEIYDHVTIFFSEIVDFTGIADMSTPKQVGIWGHQQL